MQDRDIKTLKKNLLIALAAATALTTCLAIAAGWFLWDQFTVVTASVTGSGENAHIVSPNVTALKQFQEASRARTVPAAQDFSGIRDPFASAPQQP